MTQLALKQFSPQGILTIVDIRREGVSSVVVRLSVGITERLIQARNDRLDVQLRVIGQCRWQNVPGSNVHGLCEQVMFEHNEPGVNLACIADNILPVVKDLRGACTTASNVEVYRPRYIKKGLLQIHAEERTTSIERGRGADTGPHDRD